MNLRASERCARRAWLKQTDPDSAQYRTSRQSRNRMGRGRVMESVLIEDLITQGHTVEPHDQSVGLEFECDQGTMTGHPDCYLISERKAYVCELKTTSETAFLEVSRALREGKPNSQLSDYLNQLKRYVALASVNSHQVEISHSDQLTLPVSEEYGYLVICGDSCEPLIARFEMFDLFDNPADFIRAELSAAFSSGEPSVPFDSSYQFPCRECEFKHICWTVYEHRDTEALMPDIGDRVERLIEFKRWTAEEERALKTAVREYMDDSAINYADLNGRAEAVISSPKSKTRRVDFKALEANEDDYVNFAQYITESERKPSLTFRLKKELTQ